MSKATDHNKPPSRHTDRLANNKLLAFIVSPFNANLPYLVCWLILILPAPIYYLSSIWFRSFGFNILIWDVFCTYLFALLLALMHHTVLRRCYIILITVYYVVFGIVDLYCLLYFKYSFSVNEAALVLETNNREAISMLSMYTDWRILAYSLCMLLVAVLAFWALTKYKFMNLYVGLALVVLMFIFLPNGINHIDAVAQSPIFKAAIIAYRVEPTPTAQQLTTNPDISLPHRLPDRVVLIIGESMAKKQSSLYGYDKPTNPRLDSLKREGRVLTYDNMTSADTRTVDAFHKMLSTFHNGANRKWYECDNLPTILNKSGICTRWLSMQEGSGVYANTIRCYADLCDSVMFVREITGNGYDEAVLAFACPPEAKPSFDIVHLMGSHQAFVDRYPSSYDVFDGAMYANVPEHQRTLMAQYDNSILYNDWVVSEIMQAYADEDAIVFYFPDHGLDIYDSSDNYIGHARHFSTVSQQAATNIPFVVFISDKFKSAYPDIVGRIEHSVDANLCLVDLPYAIMDIYGITYNNSDEVRQHSFFSSHNQ